MLDAITLERRGIPAVPIGVEKLVLTTGKGMARAQGFPDFPVAVIKHPRGILAGVHEPEEIQELAAQAAPQVEKILLGKR